MFKTDSVMTAVIDDVPDFAVVFGNPARMVKIMESGFGGWIKEEPLVD